MLGPPDYFILQVLAQIIEIITITGYPYDQVPVLFWFFLGLAQGFSCNHIELNMMPVHFEIASDQTNNLIDPLL